MKRTSHASRRQTNFSINLNLQSLYNGNKEWLGTQIKYNSLTLTRLGVVLFQVQMKARHEIGNNDE
jgi:hypothetical protein